MTAAPAAPPQKRLDSLDAYRGFVMFLMIAEMLRLSQVAKSFPNSEAWKWIRFHTSHVAWSGCSLHDLIQPSFSFLVGVSMCFSIASRQAKGQSFGWMLLHAIWRSAALTFLGVFLRSQGRAQTNFTFEDTLSQIGLGYVFLFLIGFLRVRYQILTCVLILVGYWGAFALYPAPADVAAAATSESSSPPAHPHKPEYTGFAAHWNKNTNLAWKFDTWFLNLFPRERPFAFNGGGYSTLSFIPTLGTMLLGLIAGECLRSKLKESRKLLYLLGASAGCLATAVALDYFGICPSVKKIWTPAWTLFSGGWCFLFLAGFHAFVDLWKGRIVVFPLIVIGANSIAAYCFDNWFPNFIRSAFKTHFGSDWSRIFGETYEPMVQGAAVMLVLWLILYWMYRHKVFVRI